MDALSILMSVLDIVVKLSLTVVIVLLWSLLMRRLPQKVKKAIPAIAASLILMTVFREIFAQQLSFSLFRTTLLVYIVSHTMSVSALLFSVCVFALSLAALLIFADNKLRLHCLVGDTAVVFGEYKPRFEEFFRRSSVILQ